MSENIIDNEQNFEQIIFAMKKHYKFFSSKEFMIDYALSIDTKLPVEIIEEVDEFSKTILEYFDNEKQEILKHSINFINQTINYNDLIKSLNESRLSFKNMANKIIEQHLERMKNVGLNYPTFQQNILDITNSNIIFFLQIATNISDFFFNMAIKMHDIIDSIQLNIELFFANTSTIVEKYFQKNFAINISNYNILQNEPVLSE